MADTREPSPRSGRVYKRGKVEKNKKDKTKSPGQRLEESGDYIDTGELNSAGEPLMIKGNLMGGEGSKINPDRQAKTKRQLEREKKLRQRAGGGGQGSDIARRKLPPGTVLLPNERNLLQISDPNAQPEFDQSMEHYRKVKDQLTDRERIDMLSRNARKRNLLSILGGGAALAGQILNPINLIRGVY